jgi:hypothetical protein
MTTQSTHFHRIPHHQQTLPQTHYVKHTLTWVITLHLTKPHHKTNHRRFSLQTTFQPNSTKPSKTNYVKAISVLATSILITTQHFPKHTSTVHVIHPTTHLITTTSSKIYVVIITSLAQTNPTIQVKRRQNTQNQMLILL